MYKSHLSIATQAFIGLASLAFLLWLALSLPAWMLNYWQAWIYWLVFLACILAISSYFLKKDLSLITSRLKVGPVSEKENSQKITQAFVSIFFILLLLVPSIDHQFQWSNVPIGLVLTGDVFVALGLLTIFLVFKENSYTSVLIEVNGGQKVISTGPYGAVRHQMYSGALLMPALHPFCFGFILGIARFSALISFNCRETS